MPKRNLIPKVSGNIKKKGFYDFSSLSCILVTSLICRQFNPGCDVCEAVQRSLFWASNRFNELLEIYTFWISFQPDWQIDNSFFSRPIKVHTQTLVHMWARTRTLALFGRRTLPEVLVCLVLLVAQPTLSRATKTLFLLMFIKYSCICLCNFFKYIIMHVCLPIQWVFHFWNNEVMSDPARWP